MFGNVLNQTIFFYAPKHEDFLTKCTSGVLTNDTVVIKSIANFTSSNATNSLVYAIFEVEEMTNQETRSLFDHDLKEACQNATDHMYHCRTIEDNIVEFSVMIPAALKYTGATLIGKLQVNSKIVNETSIGFPEINESTNVTGKFQVNGMIYSTENCRINISASVVTVAFSCTSPSKPCHIEMAIKNDKPISASDQVQFKQTLRYKETMFLITIKYAACRLDQGIKQFRCLITAYSGFSPPDLAKWEIGAFIFGIIIILLQICVFYFYCHRRLAIQSCDAKDSVPLLNTDAHFKQEKIIEGIHEISQYKGDSFLHTRYISCKKNPRHDQFIPLQKFTIDYLPQHLRDQDIVNFITTTAHLTVRLSVNFTSSSRPTNWHNPHEPVNAKTLPRIGTGFVTDVRRYQNNPRLDYKIRDCPCEKCEESPSKNWGTIRVTTALYIVFDGSEAKETTCRFRFDDKSSPLTIKKDWDFSYESIDEDRCILELKTCDESLLGFLENEFTIWSSAKNDINRKYSSYTDIHRFTFIVSHPHGCPKYVSFGKWVKKTGLENKLHTSYTYTTSTCSGCIGAYVHFLGLNVETNFGSHVHCGTHNSGNNYCGIGHEVGST